MDGLTSIIKKCGDGFDVSSLFPPGIAGGKKKHHDHRPDDLRFFLQGELEINHSGLFTFTFQDAQVKKIPVGWKSLGKGREMTGKPKRGQRSTVIFNPYGVEIPRSALGTLFSTCCVPLIKIKDSEF